MSVIYDMLHGEHQPIDEKKFWAEADSLGYRKFFSDHVWFGEMISTLINRYNELAAPLANQKEIGEKKPIWCSANERKALDVLVKNRWLTIEEIAKFMPDHSREVVQEALLDLTNKGYATFEHYPTGETRFALTSVGAGFYELIRKHEQN